MMNEGSSLFLFCSKCREKKLSQKFTGEEAIHQKKLDPAIRMETESKAWWRLTQSEVRVLLIAGVTLLCLVGLRHLNTVPRREWYGQGKYGGAHVYTNEELFGSYYQAQLYSEKDKLWYDIIAESKVFSDAFNAATGYPAFYLDPKRPTIYESADRD